MYLDKPVHVIFVIRDTIFVKFNWLITTRMIRMLSIIRCHWLHYKLYD